MTRIAVWDLQYPVQYFVFILVLYFTRPMNVQCKFVIHMLRMDLLNNCNIKVEHRKYPFTPAIYFTYRNQNPVMWKTSSS